MGVIDGGRVGDIVGLNVGLGVGGGKKGSLVPKIMSFQTDTVGLSVGRKVG